MSTKVIVPNEADLVFDQIKQGQFWGGEVYGLIALEPAYIKARVLVLFPQTYVDTDICLLEIIEIIEQDEQQRYRKNQQVKARSKYLFPLTEDFK